MIVLMLGGSKNITHEILLQKMCYTYFMINIAYN